jgi:hypothetical protein
MNFLPEKKYGVLSHNFAEKNVLCEKGDEITRFDGILHSIYGIEYMRRSSHRCCCLYINIFTVLEKDLKNVSERKLPIL